MEQVLILEGREGGRIATPGGTLTLWGGPAMGSAPPSPPPPDGAAACGMGWDLGGETVSERSPHRSPPLSPLSLRAPPALPLNTPNPLGSQIYFRAALLFPYRSSISGAFSPHLLPPPPVFFFASFFLPVHIYFSDFLSPPPPLRPFPTSRSECPPAPWS